MTTNLLETGLYTLQDAARYLKVRPAKVRRWVCGYAFAYGGSSHQSTPLIHTDLSPDMEGDQVLTFRDLMELHFIAMFRSEGVSMPTIRAAAARAAALFGTDHPFALKRFDTDGKRIFATAEAETSLGTAPTRYVAELRTAQLVIEKAVRPFFRQLDLKQDEIVRYWPLGRTSRIVLDPKRSFGQSIDSQTGVPTEALFRAVAAGESIATVARWYEVPVAAVRSAVRYEKGLLNVA